MSSQRDHVDLKRLAAAVAVERGLQPRRRERASERVSRRAVFLEGAAVDHYPARAEFRRDRGQPRQRAFAREDFRWELKGLREYHFAGSLMAWLRIRTCRLTTQNRKV